MAKVIEKTIEERLLELKKKVEQLKKEKHQTEGRLEEIMNKLKKDHGVDSIEALEKKIETLKTEQDSLEKTVMKGLRELEESYEWE